MQLLAQHGYGNGEKIDRGLDEALIDGVIFGAKDINPGRLTTTLESLAVGFPSSVRLFDPQYYATLIGNQPGARFGSLIGEESHSYFDVRRRRDLERDDQVEEDIAAVLAYQRDLNVTGLIAPNIVIRRSFDSIEATICKTFLREAMEIASQGSDLRPVYATLAVSATALSDRIELQSFLQEITELDSPPDGFYLLLEKADSSIPPQLTEYEILSRWMYVTHVLKTNGFAVINGYTDALSPYFGAAGSDAAATGWYNTQRTFTLKKFEPVSDFARRPAPRYLSATLLKSIRSNELNDLRDVFPEVLNAAPYDDAYNLFEGSTPDSPTSEALQNWEGIRRLNELVVEGDVQTSLQNCREALDEAEALYARIHNYGLTMRDRSNASHIEAIREELESFETLAEL
jgi:hypothetical protein